jgi:hypothetical protein
MYAHTFKIPRNPDRANSEGTKEKPKYKSKEGTMTTYICCLPVEDSDGSGDKERIPTYPMSAISLLWVWQPF